MRKDVRIKIIIFIALLILPTVVWGVKMLATDKAAMDALYAETEQTENRSLAKWPSDCSLNEYTGQIEQYYNDRVPFRAQIIEAGQKINTGMEKAYQKSLQPVFVTLFYKNRSGDMAVLDVDLSEEETVIEEVASEEPSEEIDEEEHDYVIKETVDPTCEEDGYILYECSDCGKTYEEKIPATGHTEELVEKTEASIDGFGRSLYVCSVCGKKIWKDFEPKPVDQSYFPLNIANNYTVMGRNRWLYYRGDQSLSYYTGENVMDEAEMKEHLDEFLKLKELCDDKGIELVIMFMPNKEIAYPEYMPTMDIVSEKKRNEIFLDYVKENSDLNFIYPLKELTDAKKYYDTYYPYDTHWNKFGAYVGTMALYDALGMEHDDVSQANVKFGGTDSVAFGLVITGALPLEDYMDATDVQVEYKEDIQLTWEEGTKDYLRGYTSLYRSVSDTGNNKKITFIGDSFREWMIPYIQRDFDVVCMVQREDMALASEDIRDTDILVYSAVERFDKDLYNRLPRLIEILSQ